MLLYIRQQRNHSPAHPTMRGRVKGLLAAGKRKL